jgi:hypothetical protein
MEEMADRGIDLDWALSGVGRGARSRVCRKLN